MNTNIIATKIGSVGKSILKPNLGIKSSRGTDNGTKKTANITALSRAKKIARRTIIKIGTRLNKYVCFVKIITELEMINNAART